MLVPPSGDRNLVDIKPSFLCSRLHHRGEAKKESAFLQKEKAGFWSLGLLVLLILIRCLFLNSPSLDPCSPLACF